jgi:hypothetical protein
LPEPAAPFLPAWSNFYVIAGSSAAALTGLMFVVITLVRGEEQSQVRHDGIATFSTPTVMHFCAALFVSAILCAPWRSLVYVAVIVGLVGSYGVLYLAGVARRAKRLTKYTADVDDWMWYTILPLLAYGALLAGAIVLNAVPRDALFVLAGGVLSLIFIGIRNSWDVVTFLAVGGDKES